MINLIDEKYLNDLKETQASESETLEFKWTLKTTEEDKSELLKDITAMANKNGGIIIYGMSEKSGVASEIKPINGMTADFATRFIIQCLQSGVEPPLNVQVNEIRLLNSGYVLAVSIPKSFLTPHRVVLKGINKFFVRDQNSVSEFRYQQLREAFTFQGQAENKIRRWKAERLALIKAKKTPRPIQKDARTIIHIMPLASFAANKMIDITLWERAGGKFGLTNFSDYLNLDGIVFYDRFDEKHDDKYVQLFRNGAIETVKFAGLSIDDRKIIPSTVIVNEIRNTITVQLHTLLAIGIQGPVVIAVTFMSIGDHQLPNASEILLRTDRENLELPEIFFESIEDSIKDIDRKVVKPILDILWQCFDVSQCPYFSSDGHWLPNGRPFSNISA